MTDFGFEILNYINNAKCSVSWVDLMNAFSRERGSFLTDDTITRLLDEKLIEKRNPSAKKAYCVLKVTMKGRRFLYEESERRQKELESQEEKMREHAEKERQQRFNNKLSIANILVPFVLFILGILAEHIARIVDFVIGIFH